MHEPGGAGDWKAEHHQHDSNFHLQMTVEASLVILSLNFPNIKVTQPSPVLIVCWPENHQPWAAFYSQTLSTPSTRAKLSSHSAKISENSTTTTTRHFSTASFSSPSHDNQSIFQGFTISFYTSVMCSFVKETKIQSLFSRLESSLRAETTWLTCVTSFQHNLENKHQ